MFTFDLNKIPDIMFRPNACQNVIIGKLNRVGINQFHNNWSGSASNIAASTINPTIKRTASKTLFFIVIFVFCFCFC